MSGDPKSALRVPIWALNYIDPTSNNTTGFQRAHMRGDNFWSGLPTEFQQRYALLDQYGIGPNYTSNFELLPETQRGGAVFGATTHIGQHPSELNTAQYDTTGQRKTFWNKQEGLIQTALEDTAPGSSEREAALRSIARREYLYNRYLGMSNLDQDVLERAGFGDTVSLANNNADWRSGSTAFDGQTANQYLASSKVQNSQLASTIESSKLWRDLEALIPDDGTFDATTADKDYAYRKIIGDAIPDYQRISPPLNQADLHPRIAAEIAYKDANMALISDADGKVDYDKYKQLADKPGYWEQIGRIEQMIRDLAAKGVEMAGKALSEIEGAFKRAFRTSAEKMGQFAEYAETRARLIVQAVNDLGDRAPDFVRHGLRKVKDYYSNLDGSINKTRVGVSLAAGALAVGNLWVEWDRRKDTPGAFEDYIKAAAEDATSLTSLAFAGGVMAAAMTPLGPVVLFTVSAVATYAAIKNIVDYLASEEYGLDENGYTYKVVKHISDSLTAFESTIKGYLDAASKELKDVAEKALETFSGRGLEWASEEAAGIVGDGNDILIGDDVSVLIGDDQNNWLVHRGAGEVYGYKGDDVLVGWLPEIIKKGEAISGYNTAQGYVSAREIRDGERAQEEQLKEWRRTGDPRGYNQDGTPKDITRDPNAIRAEQDYALKLDGGEGNDWVITILGDAPVQKGDPGAITIGGLGRDWIFNTSPGGLIYGDTEDGLYEQQKRNSDGTLMFDADGKPVTELLAVEDTAANSDNIWFWADTTLMDAQHHDVLNILACR
jgi:hypothetical protein